MDNTHATRDDDADKPYATYAFDVAKDDAPAVAICYTVDFSTAMVLVDNETSTCTGDEIQAVTVAIHQALRSERFLIAAYAALHRSVADALGLHQPTPEPKNKG